MLRRRTCVSPILLSSGYPRFPIKMTFVPTKGGRMKIGRRKICHRVPKDTNVIAIYDDNVVVDVEVRVVMIFVLASNVNVTSIRQ